MKPIKILTINPGSTSTKIAVYENKDQIFFKKVEHSAKTLAQFNHIIDQYEFRKKIIADELSRANMDLQEFDVVVGRGGLLKPVAGGVYRANEAMVKDFQHPLGEHISNIGVLLARDFAALSGDGTLALMADPTCVDELSELARISGLPEIPRLSMLHTLNQKAVARRWCKQKNLKYEKTSLIVCHMGGGISVGVHKHGKIIDVNNGLNGDGPFTPERAGGVPAGQLVELCYSGRYGKEQLLKKLTGEGGLMAYLGTNDFREVGERVKNGDPQATMYFNAMAYQISKEIGAMSTVLKGQAEGIILTGGLAFNKVFNNLIIDRIGHLAPVYIYPGEMEMEAMALYGMKAKQGKIEVMEYK